MGDSGQFVIIGPIETVEETNEILSRVNWALSEKMDHLRIGAVQATLYGTALEFD